MKNVINKFVEVLQEVIRFIIAVVVLAVLAGVFALGCAVIPLLGLAYSVCKGGSPFDNICELATEFIDMCMEFNK